MFVLLGSGKTEEGKRAWYTPQNTNSNSGYSTTPAIPTPSVASVAKSIVEYE